MQTMLVDGPVQVIIAAASTTEILQSIERIYPLMITAALAAQKEQECTDAEADPQTPR